MLEERKDKMKKGIQIREAEENDRRAIIDATYVFFISNSHSYLSQ